jgi:predicted MFS family arabinose efflux permease
MRWKDDIDQIAQTGRVDQVVLRSVVLATLINSLGYMDRVSMSIVAPSLRSEFSFSAMQIGMIFGAFSLSYALFQTPWGMIADRWPVRNLVALVILVWSASTGLTALCSTFILFLMVRFVFGVSEAALSPMIAALFRRSVSSEWRPVAFGVFLAGGACRRIDCARHYGLLCHPWRMAVSVSVLRSTGSDSSDWLVDRLSSRRTG